MSRAKKTDPAQETPEQQTDTTPEQETPEQTDATTEQTATMPEQTATMPEQQTDAAPEPDVFSNLPNPCVYCGPSIKGVARQYTTYQGGIPNVLREFIIENPDALGLIVPTGRFPAMRKKLETPGTREEKLYKAVKARL